MKTKPYIKILLISAFLVFLASSSAQSEFECVEGTQTSGSLYRTGLAVEKGMADIIDLLQIYKSKYGEPEKVFLTGASEGGLITALLIESEPNLFDAGLEACGPVGDFPYQLKYFGDARATFQFFFPRLIPGDPFKPDVGLANNWKVYYETIVQPSVFASANRSKIDQWVKVANLPFDENDYIGSLKTTVEDVLRYSVVNINDAGVTLGGFPFEISKYLTFMNRYII